MIPMFDVEFVQNDEYLNSKNQHVPFVRPQQAPADQNIETQRRMPACLIHPSGGMVFTCCETKALAVCHGFSTTRC